MPASKDDIRAMIARAPADTRWVVIICDTFDNGDYPAFFTDRQADECAKEIVSAERGENMKKLMEVYDLTIDLETQLAEKRSLHLPVITNSPAIQQTKVAKALERFSGAMLAKLEANLHKGGWQGLTTVDLVYILNEEMGKMTKAIRAQDREATRRQAVDIANYAMMLFDNLKV